MSFLSFIFLTLFIIFIFLQSGVHIENISLANVKVKTLYIKWNEKLNISAEEIHITQKEQNDQKPEIKELNNYLKKIILFDTWFEYISIKHIIYNEVKASFQYDHDKKGFLVVSSPDFELKSILFFESQFLNIEVEKFKSLKKNISVDGSIIIDSKKIELITSLQIDINNNISVNLASLANKKNLFYKISSKQNIKSIKYLVDMFNLEHAVSYWIIDAIDMSELSLNSAYGWLDYKNIDQAYKNFYAHATLQNLNYMYDPKLEAIHTKTTDIEFKSGVLNIFPRDPYTYGFYLDKSWLKIDFTKKEELLTLYLKFKGMLNQDILNLLNRYKIKLPFLQNSGDVDTDLTVAVGLRTIDVSAHGNFYTKKANFTYLGLDIDIYNTNIILNNRDVEINNMLAKYKDIATAYVDVELDTKSNKGYIAFDVKDISLKKQKIKLKKPINVLYKISPIQDKIKIDSSLWQYEDKNIKIDKTELPFYLDRLIAEIPLTKIELSKFALFNIEGDISLKKEKLKLDINLKKSLYKELQLLEKDTKLSLQYQNKKLSIKSKDDINFMLDNIKYKLEKSAITLENKILDIEYGAIKIDNNLHTAFGGAYNLETKNGSINLENIKISNQDLGEIFSNKNKTKINIQSIKDTLYINSQEFNINFILTDKNWKLNLDNLAKLSKKSKILKNYFVEKGDIHLSKNKKDIKIKFKSNIDYKYKILVLENTPISQYNINGVFNTKTKNISVNINNNININIDERIQVMAHDIGININEALRFFKEQPKIENTKNKKKKIAISTTNSYLYISKKRHVISDYISLDYFKDITTVQLRHKNAVAGFILDNKEFHLYGKDFNDEFMESLFALSKFEGGKLDFSMQGDTKIYNGIFSVKDTVVVDYKILNNILAFVNTIPSLVTFSLPSYSKNGLAVQSAYINFNTVGDGLYHLKDIYLGSKEIKIKGRGEVNFKTNKIDMKLNLNTDLGSSISKIPVVGYIFLGNDSISTSLKIDGNLDNPKVKTLIAKDIVVAPLNIIKRTLLFPVHLFKNKDKK